MSHESVNDSGARQIAKFCDYIAATAASTGDDTKATSEEVDRLVSGAGLAQSCKLLVPFTTTLDNAETLSLTVNIIHADATGAEAGAVVIAAKAVVKTATSATTFNGVAEYDVNLAPYGRFIKFEITPDLSRGGTDTAVLMPCVVLGGFVATPVSASIAD
jgi:hypothetical protein